MQQSPCKSHPNQVLHKFCKNQECWLLVCPKCALEHHKNHNIVEYGILSFEARSAKEKLLQAKKGDLMSIKKLLDGIDAFKGQLNDTKEKRKEEAHKLKLNVSNKIDKIINEGNVKCEQLMNRLIKLKNSLKESYEGQTQEMSKIPELADAVISKGTIEDLRTFFEMCQNGVETDAEIIKCKKEADYIREAIEEFIMIDPLFGFDKALYEEPKSSFQLEVLILLSEEKKLEELLSNNLTERETMSPIKKEIKVGDNMTIRTSSSTKSKAYPGSIVAKGVSSKKTVGQRPWSTRNNLPGFFKGYMKL